MTRTLEYARTYLSQGMSVIPLAFGTKDRPAKWKTYQGQRPTEKDLEKWFTKRSNLGIVCGSVSGNLVVLDFESEANYRKFFSKEIETNAPVVKTYRGYHVYVRSEEPIRTFKIKALGLDVRGEHSYVVAPPSLHPNGSTYQFVNHIREPMIVKDLVQSIKKRCSELGVSFTNEHAQAFLDLKDRITKGTRNEELFKYGCLLRSSGLPKSIAIRQALDLNDGWCDPPLVGREVATLIDSAYSKPYHEAKITEKLGLADLKAPTIDQKTMTLDEVAEVLTRTVKHDDITKKVLFLAMLLTYTESEQPNIIMTGESSVGKSWTATQVADLFPKEDVIELAYSSPSAFFYEQGTWDKDSRTNLIDMQRKIVIWLDMPHPATLVRLRPILAHDRKTVTYKATDRSEKRGHRTKTSKLIGFFSTIFCGAGMNLDPQERTRAILLSPSDDPEKIKDTIRLKAKLDTDPAKFREELEKDPDRQALKQRIVSIRDLRIRNVKVPFASDLAEEWIEEHGFLKPRDQRDFPRLLSLVKGIALLNAQESNKDENNDMTATLEDAEEAKKLYSELAQSNELGLPPHTYDLYQQLIVPHTTNGEGLTKREIAARYYKWKHRSVSQTWLDREIASLVTVGLVTEDNSVRPFRYSLGTGSA